MVSRLESGKDNLQEGVESAATHAGRIMSIVASAVRDVTREVGEFATDVFEMREASRRAEADRVAAEGNRVAPAANRMAEEDEGRYPVTGVSSAADAIEEDRAER